MEDLWIWEKIEGIAVALEKIDVIVRKLATKEVSSEGCMLGFTAGS